jgi:carboxypeptidase T
MKSQKALLAFSTLALATSAFTQSMFNANGTAHLMRAPLTSLEQLQLLKIRGVEFDLSEDRKSVLLRVDSEEDFQVLQRAGFSLQIDSVATQAFNNPPTRDSQQRVGITNFPCYRTVTEMYDRATQLTGLNPQIAQWVDIGDSYQKTIGAGGDDIRVLRISNQAITGTKPVLFLLSAIHAREYVTAETNLRFAELLLTQYATNPDVKWIVDHHDIHLAIVGNPDGRRLAEVQATQSKRKNINTSFLCAANSLLTGVDLNRNYPFDWANPTVSGSSTICTETFKGTTRASEPETQALIAHAQAIFPDQRTETPIPAVDLTTAVSLDGTGIYMDVHSNGAGNWYPWGNISTAAPNGAQMRTLGRKLGFYNNLATDKGSASGAIAGATDDFTFGTLGVTSFTLEMAGSSFFPSCTTYEASIAGQTVQSFLFAAKVVRAPFRLPVGPEVFNTSVTTNGAGLVIQASVSDTRSNGAFAFASQPAEIPNNIVGVDLYASPPWEAGATPIASFSATDGAFNSTNETVTVSVAAALIPAQKSLWYLQARDAGAAGFEKGPITAVFVGGDVIFANGYE